MPSDLPQKEHMNRIVLWSGALALLLCVPGVSLRGQTAEKRPEWVSDRPDFTNAPFVVAKGTWQIEAGLNGSQRTGSGRRRTIVGIEALWRLGLLEALEFRLANGYRWSEEGSAELDAPGPGEETGLQPLLLGFKLRLLHNEHWALSMSHEYSLRAEAGDGPNWLGNWLLLGAWSPGGPFSLALNAGLSQYGADRFQRVASASAGYQLSPRLSLFVEGFAEIPAKGAFEPQADAGLLFRVAPRWQLDLAAGGVVEAPGRAPFATLGISLLGPFGESSAPLSR
jgi:hypothetical protein